MHAGKWPRVITEATVPVRRSRRRLGETPLDEIAPEIINELLKQKNSPTLLALRELSF